MAVRYEMPIKQAPKCDPQRNRLYRMESECIGSKRYIELSLRALRRFAKAVCRQYGMPLVTVAFADLGEWGAEWAPPNTIRINPYKQGTRDLVTLSHELAHHLHDYLAPGELHEAHGPEFVACYLSILDTARIVPLVGMKAVCDHYKVRYVDPGNGRSLKTLRQRVLRGLT